MSEPQKTNPAGVPDPEVLFDPEAPALDLDAIFGSGGPLVVEVGSGNGVYLVSEAGKNPSIHYLGIERSHEFFTKCKKRIVRHGLANVRCIRADAFDVLGRALPPGCAVQVVCNFSDPWPKRRHRKRRVFREEFYPILQRALAPGGRVVFKSDVGWYFNLAIQAFRRLPGWEIIEAGPIGLPEPESGQAVTHYENKGRAAGSSIWGFTVRWKGDPSESCPSEPVASLAGS